MDDAYVSLPISHDCPATTQAIHAFAWELLSHGAEPRVIIDAADGNPDSALAQAYAAALHLTQLTVTGRRSAAPYVQRAKTLAARVSPRESATICAVAAWADGDEGRAIQLFRHVVEMDPADSVAAKFAQILELNCGDIVGMLRTSGMAAAACASGFALGLHGFALEQAGHADVAIRFARRAIALNPGFDPWAQHAMAHALGSAGRDDEAREFLHDHAADWDRCSSFMLTHNWWHLALIELDRGNPGAALALFDERIWGVRKGHAQDQINAISLLMRLQLRGVSPERRWVDIADHVIDRIGDRISGFLDLHYLIALTQAGRATEAMRLAGALSANRLTRGLAGMIVAHAAGRHDEAAMAFDDGSAMLDKLGGSDVQRKLFALIGADSVAHCRQRAISLRGAGRGRDAAA